MANERLFIVELTTPCDFPRGKHRCYSTLDNAVRGASLWIARDGKVNDVMQVYHRITGRQLGVLKVLLSGKVESHFIFEEELSSRRISSARAPNTPHIRRVR